MPPYKAAALSGLMCSISDVHAGIPEFSISVEFISRAGAKVHWQIMFLFIFFIPVERFTNYTNYSDEMPKLRHYLMAKTYLVLLSLSLSHSFILIYI